MKSLRTGILLSVLVLPTVFDSARGEPPIDAKADCPKVLPSEYRILAGVITQPVRVGAVTPQHNKSASELLADAQAGVMDLRKIHSNDDDLNHLAASGIEVIEDVNKRIESLDMASMTRPQAGSPSPVAGAEILESLVTNNPVPLLHAVARRISDAQQQQGKNQTWAENVRTELAHIVSDSHKLEATAILLKKVVAKYSAPATRDDSKIEIGFVSGWTPSGADFFALTNRSVDLEDCTIVVELVGAKGDSQTNVHFVPKWSANTTVVGLYSQGEYVLGQTLNRVTVDQPKSIAISIYSPRFSTQLSYTCDQDKAVGEICRNLKLDASYVENKRAILTAHKFSVAMTMDGVAFLAKGRVSLTLNPKDFRRPKQTIQFQFASWSKGETKSFGLPFKPDSTDVVVAFGNTGYRYETKVTE